MADEPPLQALLAETAFTPLHTDWLATRERELSQRLAELALGRRLNVLLLNATKGIQLFPSIVDFFVTLRRLKPGVRVVSSSYFEDIHELSRGVRDKGLTVVPISDVTGWTVDVLNRFDLVLAVGPSYALMHLMETKDLRARLVMLDLAFYHQLIEATRGGFLSGEENPRRAAQRNPVITYSCQPEAKVRRDLRGLFELERFDFRWFNYIPVGFRYARYCRSDRWFYDAALLGSSGRAYHLLDPVALAGLRFLFLGEIERVPELERLRSTLDVTVVPRIDEDDYARLLALCKSVVIPLADRDNVLLSVVDSLAAGKALLASRRPGFARLEAEGAPITFFSTSSELSSALRDFSADDALLDRTRDVAIAFTRTHLDIYRVLEAIVKAELG